MEFSKLIKFLFQSFYSPYADLDNCRPPNVNSFTKEAHLLVSIACVCNKTRDVNECQNQYADNRM